MKKIFVDLDGVLTDFEKKLAETLGKKLERGWDFGNDPKVWAKIDEAGEAFWTNMEWMSDGHELWDFIKDFKPTVLTAPSRHETSKSGKKIWLKENLPGVPAIIDSKKEEYAKDGYILIDDREKNIKKWEEAGGIGVLHTDAKSTIKKLKKLMDEKEKESNDLVVLRDLSARLLSLGFEKEAQHLDLVAGKWEDFLEQEKMRKSPGTMLMDYDTPDPFIKQSPTFSAKKDPFSGRFAKAITINPYDVVVQEAVQELGNRIQDVDVIQLEMTCPGDRIAWVSNKDLIKGRPGKEKIIHLCLKKIKDQFKGKFGKEYSTISPEDNRKMKEMVKEFLVNVVLPHEHVHIQQELKNQGEFGINPETEAEKAENWKAMEPFGIRRAMIARLDRIADQLESAGLVKVAYSIDAIADSLEVL